MVHIFLECKKEGRKEGRKERKEREEGKGEGGWLKKNRQRQDSNLRGQSPIDFESNALTTRPRCPQKLEIVCKLKII